MRHAFLVFLLLGFLYTLTFGGHLYSPDEEILFRTTEALTTRASLAIEPLRDPAGGTFATRRPPVPRPDGFEYAQYGIGQPMLAVPFYWLGRALRPLCSDAAWETLRDRMLPYGPRLSPAETAARLGVSLFNIPVTALSGMVLFLLARRLSGKDRCAWLAALAWGAGSLAWPHAKTFFTEPLAGLCLLLSLLCLARLFHPVAGERPGAARLAFLSGLAAGFGCLVRVDGPIFLPGLAILSAWGDFRLRREEESETSGSAWKRLMQHPFSLPVLRRLSFFLAPILAAGAVRLLLNTVHFGGPFETGYADQPEGVQFSTPILAGLYGFFFSVGKGLFFFSPPLVLAFWGIRPMLRERPAFGAAVLLLFLSFLIVMSKWRNWTGGWCWGPRHIMQIHALLAIPIAFWVAERWNSVRRIAFTSLLLAGGAVQLYGSSQDFIVFYRVYYQDLRPPVATPLYTPGELEGRFAIYPRDPQTGRARIPLDAQTGRPVFHPDAFTGGITGEVPASRIPAPINDSIYIVQNTQWTRYAEMWRMKLHDFFWLHLIQK